MTGVAECEGCGVTYPCPELDVEAYMSRDGAWYDCPVCRTVNPVRWLVH